MGDLFHKDVPFEFLAAVFERIAFCYRHTFLILTKRPERMFDFFEWAEKECRAVVGNDEGLRVLPNLHLGVSVENQEQADKRIPMLLKIPAAVRFVSVEPMLGIMDFSKWFYDRVRQQFNPNLIFKIPTGDISDVICGCESGPGARETNINWVRDLRNQCELAEIPFFLKQLMQGGKLIKMPLLDGVKHDATICPSKGGE
jgi:protein gp37